MSVKLVHIYTQKFTICTVKKSLDVDNLLNKSIVMRKHKKECLH